MSIWVVPSQYKAHCSCQLTAVTETFVGLVKWFVRFIAEQATEYSTHLSSNSTILTSD